MASNRLPVVVTEQDGQLKLTRSIGGVATALESILRTYDALWVGWTGLRRVLPAKELAGLEFASRLVPVQAGAQLVSGYYDHFANCVLWPVAHGFRLPYQATEADWAALQEIARLFAANIKRVAKPEDVIWVHDYHLILLPAALRQQGLPNPIGYFGHTPVPSPSDMLSVPHHGEILQSMCQVDVLGLQTVRDVDNFWEWLRVTGSHSQPGLVRAFPIGIDYKAHRAASQRAAVKQQVRAIQQQHPGKRIIFSASRLDYSKGIINELRSVEHLLSATPANKRKQFVYKLLVAPSREDLAGYLDLKREIEALARDINRRLGTKIWQPIDFTYQSYGFDEMVAWYLVSDVLLLTPSVDGMNLIAKEYIAARRDDRGMLVLSHTAGAAFQLTDALQVAPNDPAGTALALSHAFAMPTAERTTRWRGLRQSVRHQDVHWWANRFLSTLASTE